MADSDSNVAWHRAQLKKHREALRDIERLRFRAGVAGSGGRTETQRIVADLKRKIAASEHIVGAYEKRTRRPLTTDHHSLASVRWGNWNAPPCNR